MMRPISGTMIAIFLFGATTVSASDNANENALNQKLRLLKLEIQVAEEELKLKQSQASIASELQKIAKSKADAAAADADQNAPRIEIKEAIVFHRDKQDRQCNAKYFLIWACQAKQDCEFKIDSSICPLPAPATEPMLLKISFDCRGKIGTAIFPYRDDSKGQLTCRSTYFQ